MLQVESQDAVIHVGMGSSARSQHLRAQGGGVGVGIGAPGGGPVALRCGSGWARAHLRVLDWRQHQRRDIVWEVGLLVWRGVAPYAAVHLLRLAQQVLQQRLVPAVGAGHRDSVHLVHGRIERELCALNQAEDDRVLQPNQRLAYVLQRERRAAV